MRTACYSRVVAVVVVVIGVLCLCLTSASPSRMKRSGISDQRLAELETLLALSKLKGMTKPVAYGLIDPDKIGRRKRSDRRHSNFLPEESGDNSWNSYYPEMAPQDDRTNDYNVESKSQLFDPATLRLWRSWWSRTRRPSNDDASQDYGRA